MRSMLTWLIDGDSFDIALYVFSSISNPSWAENRIARIILKASSVKRSVASPTHLIIPLFKSFIPSNSSTRPVLSLYAIALIVKSRLFKSSFKSDENSTFSG